jgi:hypothetical protein
MLDKILNKKDKVYIQLEGSGSVHNTLGRWIRNTWGLWDENSDLYKYFKVMGLWHADDMSGLILESYKYHLDGKEFIIQAYVENIQEYWRRQSNAMD